MYTIVAGAALLVAAPQLLTFLVIALERLLVGALLAVEGALASVLLLGTRLVCKGWSCCQPWSRVSLRPAGVPLWRYNT